MADKPSPESKSQATESPSPEVLQPKADEVSESSTESSSSSAHVTAFKAPRRMRRGSYRPSHKATFVGLTVVVIILTVNAVIIALVLKGQAKADTQANQGQVTVDQAALSKLGVNRTAVGDQGIKLTVNPDAQFNGKVNIAGDVGIAGQLKLSSKFTAGDASLTQLEAGKTSLSDLNVNGDGTVSTLNLRKDLVVAGSSRLQGPVVLSQLLTVNNSANVSGSLSVGGVLAVNTLHVSSFVSDSSVTVGGHVITRGSAPALAYGSALGSNGTASISGNDASGTIAVNIGTGAGAGTLVSVVFRNSYSNTPHVIITPIGRAASSAYVNRSASGFSIVTSSGLSTGGLAFDYIVEQ